VKIPWAFNHVWIFSYLNNSYPVSILLFPYVELVFLFKNHYQNNSYLKFGYALMLAHDKTCSAGQWQLSLRVHATVIYMLLSSTCYSVIKIMPIVLYMLVSSCLTEFSEYMLLSSCLTVRRQHKFYWISEKFLNIISCTLFFTDENCRSERRRLSGGGAAGFWSPDLAWTWQHWLGDAKAQSRAQGQGWQ
jgi:hypothetical protein